MKYNYSRSLSALSIAMIMTQPVMSATRMALQSTSFTNVQRAFPLILPGTSPRKYQAPNSPDALQVISEHTDEKAITHVRMQQMYLGFQVIGGYAIIHTKSTLKNLATSASTPDMSGVIFQDLTADLGQPATRFIENGQTALKLFKEGYSGSALFDESVIPIVYMDENNHAIWAYKISFLKRDVDKIPERPTAIINAQTLKTVVLWNNVKTTHNETLSKNNAIKGQGFGGNTRIGSYQFGVDKPFLMLTRNAKTGLCYMKNDDVAVFDMENEYITPKMPMNFNCSEPMFANVYWTGYKNDGYDLYNGGYSPSNDALYVGSVIKNMYSEWYGLNVLMKGNKPMPLVMRVHYGNSYENAFWDDGEMTFGDGDTLMYPLVSLGIGAHEVSHGFTEQHSDLNYYGQSGGMNESFSDMAAQVAEFFATGVASWKIGWEIMKEDSGYDVLRYMEKPSLDGDSIDNATDYHNGMNVHYSSGVYNRLFYLLANQPDWGIRKAFHVMVKANTDYWTPYSNFIDGACGLISAATELGYPLDSLKISLDNVAINYTSCTI